MYNLKVDKVICMSTETQYCLQVRSYMLTALFLIQISAKR